MTILHRTRHVHPDGPFHGSLEERDRILICENFGDLANGVNLRKVLKYSIKVSVGSEWYALGGDIKFAGSFFMLLLPALPVGIPLYLLKRYHIGNPMLILPFYLLAPTVVFFIAWAATGTHDMQAMRDMQWMFPEYATAEFWEIWTQLKPANIATHFS